MQPPRGVRCEGRSSELHLPHTWGITTDARWINGPVWKRAKEILQLKIRPRLHLSVCEQKSKQPLKGNTWSIYLPYWHVCTSVKKTLTWGTWISWLGEKWNNKNIFHKVTLICYCRPNKSRTIDRKISPFLGNPSRRLCAPAVVPPLCCQHI